MNLSDYSLILFSLKILNEIKNIPQNVITDDSYQMQQYMNITNFSNEDMHLMKFLQKNGEKEKNEVKNQETAKVINSVFSLPNTAQRLFKVLDNDNDGKLNFYDFGNFLQISYVYGQGDTNNQYRIIGTYLYNLFNQHFDYPLIYFESKNKAKRFKMISDTYVDLLDAILIERIEDAVKVFVRRQDPSLFQEVELKDIFGNVGLQFVPDALLNNA
jgi:hypothetical protein